MSRAQNAFGHRVAKPTVSKNKCNIAVPHRNPTNPIPERQRIIGVCNHLRNERYLGSITILSFGEPGSLWKESQKQRIWDAEELPSFSWKTGVKIGPKI